MLKRDIHRKAGNKFTTRPVMIAKKKIKNSFNLKVFMAAEKESGKARAIAQ
ncbi:hypothetical protein [Legionella sp.]|uniref:hypothetical protein n=1 Tax=Legionella sp. TaxID=459 RepID=UPI0039E40968